MSSHSSFTTRGFTLVEISIVLVIIGLIAGGVLAGNSLIHAASLKKVIEEKENIVQATQVFKQKYSFLPGDFPEATTVWGMAPSDATPAADDAACAALDHTSPSVGTATCNGNGSGRIAKNDEGSEVFELFRYWQHLSNAGLISGKFTGVHGAGGIQEGVIGENILESQYNGLGWTVYNLIYQTGNPVLFTGAYNHILVIGDFIAGNTAAGYGFSSEDMYSIDSKIDDGFPGRGSVVTLFTATDCHNATSISDYNAIYEIQNDTISCVPIFRDLPF